MEFTKFYIVVSGFKATDVLRRCILVSRCIFSFRKYVSEVLLYRFMDVGHGNGKDSHTKAGAENITVFVFFSVCTSRLEINLAVVKEYCEQVLYDVDFKVVKNQKKYESRRNTLLLV